MLSDEEREALQYFNTETKTEAMHYGAVLVKLIEKKSKEIEELKETLKCTQNSWYEDTKVIEKQSKEIEELKEKNKKKSIVIIEYQDLYEKLEDKIKAKIEELENEKEKYFEKQVIQHEIEILHSLLEKE